MNLDLSSPATRKLIQRWIGAPESGNLSDPETVRELLKDIIGLAEYLSKKSSDEGPELLPAGTTSPKRIALVVGHHEGRKGARSATGVLEWDYNTDVARLLKAKLSAQGHTAYLIHHDPSISSYTGRQEATSRKIESLGGVDLALELHFNSFKEAPDQADVTGYEYLYHKGSTMGKAWANQFVATQHRMFPRMRRRGAKPLSRGQNGWGFTAAMKAPAVLLEPGFFDEYEDWITVEALADLYLEAIVTANF